MTTWCVEKEQLRLATLLNNRDLDFSAGYMAVSNLHGLIQDYPHLIRSGSISALRHVLEDRVHVNQKQALFLYRSAAEGLISVALEATSENLRKGTMSILKHIVETASGKQHRAAAEALGSLPLTIKGPSMAYETAVEIPKVRWEDLVDRIGPSRWRVPTVIGRCLVGKVGADDHLPVIKTAGAEQAVRFLSMEAYWMKALHLKKPLLPVRFDVPKPVTFKGSFVFQLENAPLQKVRKNDKNSTCYAICFMAHKDYFIYPYQFGKDRRARQRFKEMLFRNAWLLGVLAGMGIVHTAPIPLFHNRIQQARRHDGGIYQWYRGGRLDRWLHSCRYPNFGLTGIRDFEHFVSFTKSGAALYRHIGTHILSFLLVAGSYFRGKEQQASVFEPDGKPRDCRDLFDGPFFAELVRGVFFNYYHGFVGEKFEYSLAFDFETFTMRLIEEMGVDRHMAEILRVADQLQMSNRDFRRFLIDNGYTDKDADHIEKGHEDITIYSGPHLGGFNDRISLPELIAFLATTSAFCVAGKYQQTLAIH